MTNEPEQAPTSESNRSESADSRLQHLTMGLLVVIIVALAGLWIVERGHTRRAREDLLRMREAVAQQNDQVRAVLGLQPPPAIDRDSLPRRQAVCDGEARDILHMDAARGRSLGLVEGDMVEVVPNAVGEGE